jgi:hypothetical protein
MANLVYCDEKKLLKNNYYFALSTTSTPNPSHLPATHTGIADFGASGFYFAPGAPVANHDSNAPSVGVSVANSHPEQSVACATLASVPSLPASAMQGHVMPSFTHTLIGLGPFANLGCKIVFTKTAVTVYHPDGHPILAGWRDLEGPRLWHFPLQPDQPARAVVNFDLPPAERPKLLVPPARRQRANQTLSKFPGPKQNPVSVVHSAGGHGGGGERLANGPSPPARPTARVNFDLPPAERPNQPISPEKTYRQAKQPMMFLRREQQLHPILTCHLQSGPHYLFPQRKGNMQTDHSANFSGRNRILFPRCIPQGGAVEEGRD